MRTVLSPAPSSPVPVRFIRNLCALLCVLSVLSFNPNLTFASPQTKRPNVSRITLARLSQQDNAFLEDLSRRAFRYFWEQSNAETGLVLDRAHTDGSPHDEQHRTVASIAATGFGLTALCIAAERGWINPQQARERVRATLRFFAERAPGEHGWFYHWLDAVTGERRWYSEVSSIDTALLLAGVLTARATFHDYAVVVRLATLIY